MASRLSTGTLYQTNRDIHFTGVIYEQTQTAEGGVIQRALICRNPVISVSLVLKELIFCHKSQDILHLYHY